MARKFSRKNPLLARMLHSSFDSDYVAGMALEEAIDKEIGLIKYELNYMSVRIRVEVCVITCVLLIYSQIQSVCLTELSYRVSSSRIEEQLSGETARPVQYSTVLSAIF